MNLDGFLYFWKSIKLKATIARSSVRVVQRCAQCVVCRTFSNLIFYLKLHYESTVSLHPYPINEQAIFLN